MSLTQQPTPWAPEDAAAALPRSWPASIDIGCDTASRRQCVVIADSLGSPRASSTDRVGSYVPQQRRSADSPLEHSGTDADRTSAGPGSSTHGGAPSVRDRAATPQPPPGAPAELGNGYGNTGTRSSADQGATLPAGSAYQGAATKAMVYCLSQHALANRDADESDAHVLRRAQSQDRQRQQQQGRAGLPSPTEPTCTSRSLPSLAGEDLFALKVGTSPESRAVQQQQQQPPNHPLSASHPALATPPLTASAPHSAASSLLSLQMLMADVSALAESTPPTQHNVCAMRVAPADIGAEHDAVAAVVAKAAGSDNGETTCGHFIVHKPHTPPASNSNSRSSSSSSMQSSTMLFAETANGDAPNRRSMGDAQDRPMSSIILVAATDENSGCGRSSFVQRQRETNWFRRQSKSSSLSRQPSQALSTANTLPDQTAHYESLLLKVQDQRNAAMAEAAALQQQLDEQRRAHASDVARLRENLESTTRKLCSEFELRAAAEAKCSRMEFELAELSSNIQLEAQNLVAHERREHTSELERVARKHEELAQLMEMERAQVDSLKHSLERATRELDEEREEAERLRSGMVAFERQMSTLIGPFRGALGGSVSAGDVRQGVLNGRPARTASGERQAQSTAQSFESASAAAAVAAAAEPHITGRIFFGSDAVRADTRLAEFLGFINAASDKEAQSSVFMQRSMREDVEPTLATDTASVSLLSGWSKHRRLIHCVQDTSLALESYTPRIHVGRVLSPACYLCGCSVTRLAGSPLADQKSLAAERRTSGRTHEMYRMRFGDDDTDNKPLCAHCHGRMVTVCSFFDYLKIVRRGLIKRPIADIWLEVNRARLQMWLARSGASADSNLMISAV